MDVFVFDGTDQVSAWRPLDIVRDRPLVFCHPESIENCDLIPVEYHTANDYAGEIYQLRYNENQRWMFLADQHPGEIALFLTYDTKFGSYRAGKSPRTELRLF